MSEHTESLAETLYATYCEAVGGKAFNGDPLPTWQEFVADNWKQAQVQGWRAVATKVLSEVTFPHLTFPISAEDAQRIREFIASVNEERGSSYEGASGGATTYEFTPTSLGLVTKVRHFDKELDLTRYEDW